MRFYGNTYGSTVVVFDLEYVPDVETGRRVYNLSEEMPDLDVVKYMQQQSIEYSEVNRSPMIKNILQKIISVSAVISTVDKTSILTLKVDEEINEKDLIKRFIGYVGSIKPQLVGWGILKFDIPILKNRAIVNNVEAKDFFFIPEKPWEGISYMGKFSTDYCIDLFEHFSSIPALSLHDACVASKIPGKLDISGNMVCDMYYDGKINEIAIYNEFDTISTYMLYLKTCVCRGLITNHFYEIKLKELYNIIGDKQTHKKYIEKCKEFNIF